MVATATDFLGSTGGGETNQTEVAKENQGENDVRRKSGLSNDGSVTGEQDPATYPCLSHRFSKKQMVDPLSHTQDEAGSPKSQKKFVSTWKMACDKTKDKTKDLLKRWRTLPGPDSGRLPLQEVNQDSVGGDHGWSVHVWGTDSTVEEIDAVATWVKRYPSDEDGLEDKTCHLTQMQKDKFSHFFSHVFDMDRDDMISLQDFEAFTERIRHFADWSTNSSGFLVLEQIQQGFVETFIILAKAESSTDVENTPADLDRIFLSLDEWLVLWDRLLRGLKSFHELPLWLQYFPKVLFSAVNRSGSGTLTREELSSFYTSVMGYTSKQVADVLDRAYKAMTSNGEHPLTYEVYRLCFANFIFGRFPNGPGEFIFGATLSRGFFPIDYSAMNTPPENNELYSFDKTSNRNSVIV